MKQKLFTRNRIILGLLVLSVIANLVLTVCLFYTKSPKSVVGTYTYGQMPMSETGYCLFNLEGRYAIWKEDEMLEEGTYREWGDGTCELTPDNGGEVGYAVFDGDGTVYHFDRLNGTPVSYKRIYYRPIYINVDPF